MAAPLLICTSRVGTSGTYAAAFVDYQLQDESRHHRPQEEQNGHPQRPPLFRLRAMTYHSAGRILVSRNASSHAEMLTAIGG
jgi:hypothetical protein